MMPSNILSAENRLIEQNYKTLSELDCHMYTSVSSTRGAEVVVIAIHEWDRNRAVRLEANLIPYRSVNDHSFIPSECGNIYT